MAKKKTSPTGDPVDENAVDPNEGKSNEEIYNLHNHETAQRTDARMQCQCENCDAHRESL